MLIYMMVVRAAAGGVGCRDVYLQLSPLQVRFDGLRNAGATQSNLHLFPRDEKVELTGQETLVYPAGLTLSACGGKLSSQQVARRRAVLAHALQLEPPQLHFLRQVHGTKVVTVQQQHRDGVRASRLAEDPRDPEADALVTAQPNTALCVLMADCAGVLLYDPKLQVQKLKAERAFYGEVGKWLQRCCLNIR